MSIYHMSAGIQVSKIAIKGTREIHVMVLLRACTT